MSRREDRKDFTEATRIGLLETDADSAQRAMRKLEDDIEASLKDMRASNDAKIDEIRKIVVGLQRILIGILVSLATASILLAVNIGVGK